MTRKPNGPILQLTDPHPPENHPSRDAVCWREGWYTTSIAYKPGLKLMRQERLPQVPSGKTTIWGQAPPMAARRWISRTVFWRDVALSLSTSTGCVNLISAVERRQLHHENTVSLRTEKITTKAISSNKQNRFHFAHFFFFRLVLFPASFWHAFSS